MGAWLSYGLGRMNENLPDFIVLNSAFWSGDSQNVQGLYSRLWGSGFLPSKHQGVPFQPSGDPVLFLSNPANVSQKSRAKMIDLVTKLNEEEMAKIGDPEIQTTIAQQEMAFRMQASVPDLTDLTKENETINEKLYGPEVKKSGSFARNCLLARRMAERGVRFIQLFHLPEGGRRGNSVEAESALQGCARTASVDPHVDEPIADRSRCPQRR